MGRSSMVEYHTVKSGDVGSIPSDPSFLIFFFTIYKKLLFQKSFYESIS